MRVTKERAAGNRARVVEEAERLFRERGFDGVGVAEVMAAAGFTHGGFYNHFGSKADVEAAACAKAFEGALERIAAGADDFAGYCARFVSAEARDAPATRCPMVSFAGDMPRQHARVQDAYAEGLAAYLDAFAAASGEDRAAAIRRYALMVGALTLARSVAAAAPGLSDEILAAAREA